MRWNVNLLILLTGALGVVAAAILNMMLVPGSVGQMAPIYAPALVGLALVFGLKRAWTYLAAGILTALFPLVVVFVFGASGALTHPGGGWDTLVVALMLGGALLALLGGIVGFAQARRDAQPGVGAGLRAGQGLAALLVVGIFVGFALANGFASAALREQTERPVAYAETVDQHVTIMTTGAMFAPRSVTLGAGNLTSLDIRNDDAVVHTFSYQLADGVHETAIPAHSRMSILVKFDTPQTIHVWCQPHSGGPDDRAEGSMWMDMTVA